MNNALMSAPFAKEYIVTFSDMDMNGHLKNSAYSEYATDVRIAFLRQIGMPLDLSRVVYAPVALRELFDYRSEIRHGQSIVVDLALQGIAHSRSRFLFKHCLYSKEESQICCVLWIEGAFINFKTRKLCRRIPPEIYEGIEKLHKAENFQYFDKSFRLGSHPI